MFGMATAGQGWKVMTSVFFLPDLSLEQLWSTPYRYGTHNDLEHQFILVDDDPVHALPQHVTCEALHK